ncbi:helix-turn-helix transcriptional regulator [Anaerotruncus rubiinfantis]
MTFGEKLKQLRIKQEYSQEALAELLHVSRQAVTKWENGVSLR